MGSALVSAVDGIERPTVGLLNIGEEDIKGNDVVKQTAELLKTSGLNFYGNVEGDDIYKGTTDVVVCDGFVGNVVLKTSEGLAHDALRDSEGRIHAQSADAARGARRVSGADGRSSAASIRAATTAPRWSA